MTLVYVLAALLAALALVAGTFLTLMRRGVGTMHTLVVPGLYDGTPDETVQVRVKEDHPLAKLLTFLSLGRQRAVCDGETIYLADGDLGASNEKGSSGVLHELAHVLQRILECDGDRLEFLARISVQWVVGFYWNGKWERQAREYAKRNRATHVIQYSSGHFWLKSPVDGTWRQICQH